MAESYKTTRQNTPEALKGAEIFFFVADFARNQRSFQQVGGTTQYRIGRVFFAFSRLYDRWVVRSLTEFSLRRDFCIRRGQWWRLPIEVELLCRARSLLPTAWEGGGKCRITRVVREHTPWGGF